MVNTVEREGYKNDGLIQRRPHWCPVSNDAPRIDIYQGNFEASRWISRHLGLALGMTTHRMSLRTPLIDDLSSTAIYYVSLAKGIYNLSLEMA